MLTSSEIEPLLYADEYPAAVATSVLALSPLAVEIANRWMLGWPTQTKALLAAGTYLPILKAQEKQEREILASTQTQHLARHELMAEYGLRPAPPM